MKPSSKKQIVFEPFEAFKQAERFYVVLEQLHRTSDQRRIEEIGIPVIVLSAFASELFLKCLVAIEKGSTTKEHFLDSLFEQLSARTQAMVEKYWNLSKVESGAILDNLDMNSGKKWPRDLRSNLKSGRDGFYLLRYIYEDLGPFEYNLGSLPTMLRQTVAELRPDWFAKPTVNEPHPVFIESKNDAPDITITVKTVIDNKAAAFQWAVRWTANLDDLSSA